jgi:hypothetical protein
MSDGGHRASRRRGAQTPSQSTATHGTPTTSAGCISVRSWNSSPARAHVRSRRGHWRPIRTSTAEGDERDKGQTPEQHLDGISRVGHRPALGVGLDAFQHLALHGEVCRREDRPIERCPEEAQTARGTPTHQQARGASVDGVDDERPGPIWRSAQRGADLARGKDECAPRLEESQRRVSDAAELVGRIHPELVADLPVLQRRVEVVEVLHFAAHEAFEDLVAIKSPTVLPKLGDPRPYLLCRRLYRHGTRLLRWGTRHERSARQRAHPLRCCSASPPIPGAHDDDEHTDESDECSGE